MQAMLNAMNAVRAARPVVLDDEDLEVSGGCSVTCGESCGGTCTGTCKKTDKDEQQEQQML